MPILSMATTSEPHAWAFFVFLAANLAVDVVVYGRLMGEDEVGTLERLKSLRKELVQTDR